MENIYSKTTNYQFYKITFLVFILLGFLISQSSRAAELMVEEKIVLNVSPKAVWALVGGFKALDRWHPDVVDSELIGTGKNLGDIRILTLGNNDTIVERLDFYDEDSMTLQYRILESPLPIENYQATIAVVNKDDNLTEVVWKSYFDEVDISEDEITGIIRGIYVAGFQSLENIFK